jgi:hypothetical protein
VRNLARVPGDSFGFEPDKTLTKFAHDHLARNNAAGGEIGFTFSKGFKPFNGRPSVVRSISHAVTVGECRVQFQPHADARFDQGHQRGRQVTRNACRPVILP